MIKQLTGIIFSLLSLASLAQSANFSTSLAGNENCGPVTVTFTIDNLAGVNSYEWDFGNGESTVTGTISASNDGSASTTYTSAGQFSPQLTVNGSIYTVQAISIHALPKPNYEIKPYGDCLQGFERVNIEYKDSIPDFGAPITQWVWNFGDGTVDETLTSGGSISHNYTKSGSFTPLVTVTDANGCSSSYFESNGVKINSTPQADFEYDYSSDCNFPLSVDLSEKSTDADGNIDTYEWELTAQGSSTIIDQSTTQNTTLTIPSGGTYNISLKVTTTGGCTDEIVKTIVLEDNIVDFTPSTKDTVCQGAAVSFQDLSLDGAGQPAVSYLWNFGDGNTSTDKNPSHYFLDITKSPYDVTLEVTFSNGCVSSLTKDSLITATFAESVSISVDILESCKNYIATFNARPGSSEYKWDFDYDGVTPNYTSTTNTSITTHEYTREDTFHIYAQMTTPTGCVVEEEFTDSIIVNYPVAKFDVTSNQESCGKLDPASFDADSSTNLLPNGENSITKYFWDFNNDGEFKESTKSNISHTYVKEGEYDVTLVIKTETGCYDTIIKPAAIQRGKTPTAKFTYAPRKDSCRRTAIRFENLSTAASSRFPIDSVYWDFGDGKIIYGNPIGNDSIKNPIHAFRDDTDDDGNPIVVSLQVFTNGCPSDSIYRDTFFVHRPVARFRYIDLGRCFPKTNINFEAYDPSNPNRLSEGVDEWRWDFGDGTSYPADGSWEVGNDPTINHSYNDLGEFRIVLHVKNNANGCFDAHADSIFSKVGFAEFDTDNINTCYSDGQITTTFINKSLTTSNNPDYFWEFGAGAVPDTFRGGAPPPVYYTTPGLKTVKLTLNQGDGCTVTEEKVGFMNVGGPVANFNIASDNSTATIQCLTPDEFIKLTSSSSNTQNTNVTFDWNFGSGANPPTATQLNQDQIEVKYNTPGEKTIRLIVTDNQGCVDTIQRKDVISVPATDADFVIETAGEGYCNGEDIKFSNESIEDPNFPYTSYEWDFGPNATPSNFSGVTPPNIVYNQEGNKVISLVVTDNKGCTASKTKNINIYKANASFDTPGNVTCAPISVPFNNTSVDISKNQWDFGDGQNSDQFAPSNTYFYPGEYDVRLVTTNKGGCNDTAFAVKGVVVEGSYYGDFEYTLTGNCLSSPSDPEATFTITDLKDTKILTFDFGDGSPAFVDTFPDPLNPPSPYVITHTYSVQGEFAPKLTLEDDPSVPGACGPFVYPLTVDPIIISTPPIAYFNTDLNDTSACQDNAIKFRDRTEKEGGLIDNRFPIDTYAWDFGDSPAGTSTQKNPSYTYNTSGSFTVNMTITTSIGCTGSVDSIIKVDAAINDATAGGPSAHCVTETITLDGATPTGGIAQYNYLWEESLDNTTWSAAPGINDQEDYTLESKSITTQTIYYYRRSILSGGCQLTSPTFEVTIDPETIGGDISSDRTECFDESKPSTIVLSGERGSIIEWQSSLTADFNIVTVIPHTAKSYTFSNLTESTYFRTLVQSGVCLEKTSDSVLVTVKPEITGNVIKADTAICSNDDAGIATATAPAGGEGNFAYQWQLSDVNSSFFDIAGANQESYAIGNLSMTSKFRRVVTSNGDCQNISDTMVVDVTTSPDTTLPVQADDVCVGSDASIVISNSQNNYQYRILDFDNGLAEVASGTGNLADLTITVTSSSLPLAGNYFRFIIESSSNNCIENFPLDSILVNQAPDLNLSFTDGGNICAGVDAIITINGSEDGYIYEVQDTDNGNNTVGTGTGTGLDFDITVPSAALPLSGTFNYQINVTNGSCSAPLNNTGSFDIIGTPDSTSASLSSPFVCEDGAPANTDIIISNSQINVTYQVKLVTNKNPESSAEPGNGGDLTLSVVTPAATTRYYVEVVPDANISCPSIILKDTITLTFINIPTDNMTVTSSSICENDTSVITVSNTTSNIYYILRQNTTNLDTIVGNGGQINFEVSPNPSVTTTYNILAQDTTNNNQCPAIELANNATVTILPIPDSTALVSDLEICEGDGPFSITVNPTSADVTYFLREQNGTLIESVDGNGSTLTFSPLNEPISNEVYKVTARPKNQNLTGAFCNEIELIDSAIINFYQNPQDVTALGETVCSSLTGSVKIENSEDGVEYRLYLLDDTFVDGPIMGNGNEISFTAINPSTTTTYKVDARRTGTTCDSIFLSTQPQIEVIPAPSTSLNVAPTDPIVCEGEQFDITVTATEQNVEYLLAIGGIAISGQSFDGDGMDQSFSVTASKNEVYDVLALPTQLNSDGNKCPAVQLSQSVNLQVEGEILIDQQPFDFNLCDNGDATFEVKASTNNGGTLIYQWQESTTGSTGTWNDLTNGGDYSGVTSESLKVSNAASHQSSVGNDTVYRVVITTNQCTEVVSEAKKIIASISPEVSGLSIFPQDHCLGSNALVNFTSSLADGQEYKFLYRLSGANTADSLVSISTVVAADGSGSFEIDASNITTAGVTAVVLTEVDYGQTSACNATGLALVELFNTQPLPDTTDLKIATDSICAGSDMNVNISGNLINEVYEFTYDLTGNNTSSSNIVQVGIINGEGSFTIPGSQLINGGNTDLTLTSIKFVSLPSCDVQNLAKTTPLYIEDLPDITALQIIMDSTCLGNGTSGELVGNLTDGDYNIIFDITGANNHINITQTITVNNDTALVNVDAQYLELIGTDTIIVRSINNGSGLNCGYDNLATEGVFTVEYAPKEDSIFLFIQDACENGSLDVLLTSNLIDNDYEIEYSLSGANGSSGVITDTVSLGTSDGKGVFQLPSSASQNPGLTNINLLSIKNISGKLGCSISTIAQTAYTIEAKPNVIDFVLDIDNTCPSVSTTASISGNLVAGEYFVQFDLTGTINALGLISNLEIDINGEGSLELPGSYLPNPGTYNVENILIRNSTSLGCDTLLNGLISSFQVEDLPSINSLNLAISDICVGNSADVTVTSSLTDDTYQFVYDVRGINNHTNIIDTVTTNAGNTNFTISDSLLMLSGTTEVVVTQVNSTSGAQCGVITGEYGSTTFEVENKPDSSGLAIYAYDACLNEDIKVLGLSSVVDGNYTLSYELTGRNIGGPYTTSILLNRSNGIFEFFIPATQIPVDGATTISILSLADEQGQLCETVITNVTSNFTISPAPSINNLNILGQNICLEEDEIVELASELADGTYIVGLNITGANPIASLQIPVNITSGDGSGFVVIPANLLTNPGLNNIEIKEVIDNSGAQCNSLVAGVSTSFTIEPIPIITDLKIKAESICSGTNAHVKVSGNLADGEYLITYDLAGANTATDETLVLTISSGDGSGEFIIPSTLLSTSGSVDLDVKSIAVNNGLLCEQPLSLTDDFFVVSITLTFDAEIIADDVCLGNGNLIGVLSNLPDLDYAFTYNLSGANSVTGLADTATIKTGLGYFPIADSLLKVNGTQTITITGVTVLGVDACSVNGLDIDTTFDIQGNLVITENPVADNQCYGNEIEFSANGLNNGPGTILYQWKESRDGTSFNNLSDQGVYSGAKSSTLIIDDNTGLNGYFYQLAISTRKCPEVTTDSVKIEVFTGSLCGDGLENIPDAFSPNGDGTNDTWVIDGAENYPNNEVKVFNRWGTIMYQVAGYDNNSNVFNGNKNKGGDGPVVDGTYFYTIDLGDGSDLLRGYLVIQR